MRHYLGWIGDPAFHLILIGAMLLHLGMILGAAADAERPLICTRCNHVHSQTLICPTSMAQLAGKHY